MANKIIYKWNDGTTKEVTYTGSHVIQARDGYENTSYLAEIGPDAVERNVRSGDVLYGEDGILVENDSWDGDGDENPDDGSDVEPSEPGILTVYFHSNYADASLSGLMNPVSGDRDAIVGEYIFTEGMSSDEWPGYRNSTDSLHMTRAGYRATGNWIAFKPKSEPVADPSADNEVLIKIHQDRIFNSLDELCDLLGLSEVYAEDVDEEAHVYAEWEKIEEIKSNVRIKTSRGWVVGTLKGRRPQGVSSAKVVRVKTENGWR